MEHGHEKFYSFEYKNNLGQVSLRNIAEELDGFIKQNVFERDLNIVGSGTPSGLTGQIQFNNAGSFGADTNFYWDNNKKMLVIIKFFTNLDILGNPISLKYGHWKDKK
jgi:hypothetical protein